MIQFFKAVSTHYTIEPCNYGVTNDIMEQIYVGNPFLNVIMNNLVKGGHLYNEPILWTGNLAFKGGASEMELYKVIKPSLAVLTNIKYTPYRFLINESKKQFVDLNEVEPIHRINSNGKAVDVKINPLPLLVCDSYGIGMADNYYDTTLFGFWINNIIIPSNIVPDMEYNQLIFNLACI